MNAIAEGIETGAQLNLLRKLGCPLGQGYYLSKPLPAEDAERLIGFGGVAEAAPAGLNFSALQLENVGG